jgi:hypothetical protein
MSQSELLEYQPSWCLSDIMNTINPITSIFRTTRVGASTTLVDKIRVNMILDFAESERPNPFCHSPLYLTLAASKWFAPAKQDGVFPYDFVDNSPEVALDENYEAFFTQSNKVDKAWLKPDTTVPGDTWYEGKNSVWVIVTLFLFKD